MTSAARWVAATSLAVAAGAAAAQGASEAVLPPVSVTSIRDPEAFDVARTVQLRRTFESISPSERSRIRLSFFVRPAGSVQLPDDLRVGLVKDDRQTPVTLLPSGELLLLPHLEREDVIGSDIVASVPRGTIKIVYFVQPVRVEPMTMGDLRGSLVEARQAWKRLYGPLTGWTVPAFTCARGHYSEPSVTRLLRVGPERSVVWTSTAAKEVSIPTSRTDLADDLLVDWGAVPPGRIGGCVETGPRDERTS